MKEFLKHNGIYLGLYLIALLIASYFLLTYSKILNHQMLNYWVGNPVVNTFYKYFTHVGDGIFAVSLGVVVMFFNFKRGQYVVLAYMFAGLTSSCIKWFFNYVRPHHYFGYYHKHYTLNLVDGVEMLGERSFPSGHSTAAFVVFSALAFSTESKLAKVIFFIIALNAAFSRMYLSQHWLVDIVTGSLIGITYAIILYFAFYKSDRFHIKLNIFKPN
ncbi:MAG: phosphatase PAP2 family protein [Sphingobacteriaceae bacterium]|nr:phosphatase PAP2 family protein [Sphingobacteriaceae bacterium]